MRVPVLLTSAVLLCVGCGGPDDEPPRTPVVTTAVAPPPVLEGASTSPTSWEGASSRIELLTAVRTGEHPRFDRVVFQFRKGVPGYDVRYVEPPVLADGSGDQVDVAGGAVLLVRMEPALDADLTKESVPRSYTGPTRFSPPADAVVELVRTGGFEGVLTWAVGIDEIRPFRITRLDRPARIVIDIARD